MTDRQPLSPFQLGAIGATEGRLRIRQPTPCGIGRQLIEVMASPRSEKRAMPPTPSRVSRASVSLR